MRAVAMKLHTREQAPKEGKVEAPKQQAVSKQSCCSRAPIPAPPTHLHPAGALAVSFLRNHPQAVAVPKIDSTATEVVQLALHVIPA